MAILVERVDQRLDLPGRVMRSQMIRGDETERQRMCAYLSAACAGGGAVRVEYAQKGGYGRCYPVAARKNKEGGVRGATCYTKMRGPVRAALAGLLYHDLDLVNAQPVLALQLAARAGVPREQLPHLARLVERREECLAEVMRACGVARAAAKNLYVREMFKGSCDRWAADNGVARAAVPQFARDLQADVDLAARAVVAADARAREWQRRHKPDAPRPLATAFALACQQAEHECLLAMHGAALGAGRRVGAWIYDGLLVERRPGAAGAGPAGDALLRLMEARVRERTGMEVRVAEKPMHVWEIYCEPPARGMPAPERPGPEVERALRRELLEQRAGGGLQQKLDAGSLAYDEDHNVLFTVGGGAEAGEMRTAQLGMLVVGGVVRGPLRAAEPFFVGRLELPRAHHGKVGADRWAARWGAVVTGEMMVVDGGGAREFMLELTNNSAPRGMIRMAVRCSSDDGADQQQQLVVLGDADLTQLDFPRRAVLRLDAAARDKVFAETCNGWVQDVLRRVMRVEDAIVARVADRVAERVGAAVAEQMMMAASASAGAGLAGGVVARPDVELVDPEYLALRERFERTNFYLSETSEFVEQLQQGSGVGMVRRSHAKLAEHYGDLTYMATAAGKWVKFVRVWMDDPGKRKYARVAFAPPPAECPPGAWNSWGGFRAQNLPECPPGWDRAAALAPFEELVDVVTGGDAPSRHYLLAWHAQLMQQPGSRPRTCVTLFSELHGTGKSFFGKLVATVLVGARHAMTTSDLAKFMVGDFEVQNREELLYAVLNEVSRADMARSYARMTSLVTEEDFVVNKKGVTAYACKDFHRQLRTTNQPDALVIAPTDRRNAVLEASGARLNDAAWFQRVWEHYHQDARNARALWDFLAAYDVSGVDWVRDRPRTLIFQQMAAATPPPKHVEFLLAACKPGGAPAAAVHVPIMGEGAFQVTATGIHTAYVAFCRAAEGGEPQGGGGPAKSQRELGAEIARLAARAAVGAIEKLPNKRLHGSIPCVWYTVRPELLRPWLLQAYGLDPDLFF